MQARAIPGPWAAGERILVCVSEDPRSAASCATAKRLADRLHAPWTALCRRDARAACSSARSRRTASPRPCGWPSGSDGEAVTLPAKARRIADDVIGFAHKNNVTHIIVGKSTRSRWFEILHGSVVHDLVRRAGNISVHVIAGEELGGTGAADGRRRDGCLAGRSIRCPTSSRVLAVAAALGVSVLLRPLLGIENVDLIFLTAIVGIAVRYGLWPSLCGQRRRLAAATTSSSCRRSTPSRSPIRPTSRRSLLFALLSVVVSNLAARGQTQTVTAHERVRSVESLYAFSRKLAGAGTLDDVLWATAHQIASMLKVRVVLLLPENGSIAVKAGYPPEDSARRGRSGRRQVGLGEEPPGGRDSDALPGAKWLFLPMRTGRGPIGILGISRDEPGPLLRASSGGCWMR